MRGIRLSLVTIVVLMALVLVFAGCGRKGLVDVNGEKIKKDEFYARLERVPVQTMKGGKAVTVPAGQYVVEQIITEQLLTQLAKKDKVAPTEAQMNKKISYLKKTGNFAAQLRQMGVTEPEWKRQMTLQQSVVNLLTKNTTVTEAELKKTYDVQIKKVPSPFVRPEACSIAVIITKAPEKIQKAYKLLQDGQDFGTVAMQLSEDKNTAPIQGQVGWLSMDMAVVPMPIRTAAFATTVGKYSKPFFVQDKADRAWVIVKVNQKRKRIVQSYIDVKDLIKEQLQIAKADRKPFNKELQDFIQKSDIVVNYAPYAKIPEMMKKSATVPTNLPATKPAAPAR